MLENSVLERSAVENTTWFGKGHKCFSYNAYTRIPRPEIIMGSWVISSML